MGCSEILDRGGSIKPRGIARLEILRHEGYAVLLADRFTKRGYDSICGIGTG